MELPKFFGIDIGRSTTKVVLVSRKSAKATPTVEKLFSFQTGQGSLAADDFSLRSDLAVRIRDAINGSGLDTRKCVLALPEPAVFNRLLTFPDLPEKELEEAVHWNAKQFVPIPIEEVQMDWIKTNEITVEGKKMVQLLLVAAPKKIINQAVTIFKEAELDLIAIETEAVATARAIAHCYPDSEPLMVMDVGSSGTDISVVAGGKLIFSQSLGTGTDAMTGALSSAFSLDKVQAEQYRTKFGLMQGQADDKIYNALVPVVDIIVTEVVKTLNFFRSKYQESTPKSVVLLGEGAKLPGVTEYFSAKLNLNTQVADLSSNLNYDKKLESELQASKSLPSYTVALGLALKTE